MKKTVMQEKLGKTPEGRELLGLIEAAGSPGQLAEIIGVSRQDVYNWIYLSGRVSRNGALLIESQLDVRKELLRPDITDWDKPDEKELTDELAKTECGRGLLLVLERVKNSRRALALLLGMQSGNQVTNWMRRNGRVPRNRVKQILALPDFAGLTAEQIRPDLHEKDYL